MTGFGKPGEVDKNPGFTSNASRPRPVKFFGSKAGSFPKVERVCNKSGRSRRPEIRRQFFRSRVPMLRRHFPPRGAG